MNINGEGDIIKTVIFLIGSLLVSAIVIVGFVLIVPSLMKNTEEQIISKDIGLTIMTVSASPNSMVYRYDQNTENYEIRITQEEVQTKSREGSGKYKYLQMIGIKVEDALIQNKLIIPITLKDGKISFSDSNVEYSDVCSAIPSTFNDDSIKVKLELTYGESLETEKKLQEIISFAKMYSTQADSKVKFVESNEDIRIILKTGPEKNIKYYESIQGQKLSWYHRIACYAVSGMNSDNKIKSALGEFSLTSSPEEDITIILGDDAKFADETTKDMQLSLALSNKIYDAIELGITE